MPHDGKNPLSDVISKRSVPCLSDNARALDGGSEASRLFNGCAPFEAGKPPFEILGTLIVFDALRRSAASLAIRSCISMCVPAFSVLFCSASYLRVT